MQTLQERTKEFFKSSHGRKGAEYAVLLILILIVCLRVISLPVQKVGTTFGTICTDVSADASARSATGRLGSVESSEPSSAVSSGWLAWARQ